MRLPTPRCTSGVMGLSRVDVPGPAPIYLQVLTPQRAGAFLRDRQEHGFDPKAVQGLFCRADHLGPRPTPERLLREFRPDGKLTAAGAQVCLLSPTGSLLVLCFAIDPVRSSPPPLPHDPVILGRPRDSVSFVSCFRLHEPTPLLPGATIEEIDGNGGAHVHARLELSLDGVRRWRRFTPRACVLARSTAFTPRTPFAGRTPLIRRGKRKPLPAVPWQGAFVECGGWLPLDVIDERRGLIVMKDRRALRMRCGALE